MNKTHLITTNLESCMNKPAIPVFFNKFINFCKAGTQILFLTNLPPALYLAWAHNRNSIDILTKVSLKLKYGEPN